MVSVDGFFCDRRLIMSDQSERAFDHAIKTGKLSVDPKSEKYAGLYMFMREESFSLHFKHVNTRKYIEVPK